MISAATLRVSVAVTGLPDSTAKIREFQGKLQEVAKSDATATLAANVNDRGFDEFAAKLDETKLKTAKPIEQKVGVNVDRSGFSAAIAKIREFKEELGAADGGSGGSSNVRIPGLGHVPLAAIAAASPVLLNVAGAATAVAGSAAEAAAGVGALAIGGGGVAGVGLVGLAAVAVPAISSLKSLYTAQTAYNTAVAAYGRNSTQATTALTKLTGAEKQAGPGATALVKNLESVKARWMDLSKPGQASFFGLLNDGLDKLQAKLPLFAKSADSSMAALRTGFDDFLNEATGPGFNRFIGVMTGTFATVVPEIGHGLGDWAQILMRIAVAAEPSLERMVRLWEGWSESLLRSLPGTKQLEGDISGLVAQTMSWVHLLDAAGHLIITIFGDGAQEGQRAVDDLTGKLEEWNGWLEGHKGKVDDFFTQSVTTTEELATLIAGLTQQWFVFAQGLQPVAQAFLSITRSLNSLKIGNISALTALLTAYVGIRTVGKVAPGISAIGTVLASGGVVPRAARGAAPTVERSAGEFGEKKLLEDAGLIGGGAAGAGGGALATAGAFALPAAIAGIGAYKIATHTGHEMGDKIAGGLLTAFESKSGPGLAKAVQTSNIGKLTHLQQSLRVALNLAIQTGSDEASVEPIRKKIQEIGKAKSDILGPVKSALTRIDLGQLAGLPALVKDFTNASTLINQRWKAGTGEWRKFTVEAMQETVASIQAGMQNGSIKAESGHKRIAHILEEIQIVKGSDPLGLAGGVVSSFKKAGSVTQSGITELIHDFGRMPKGAREKSQDAVLEMANAWAKGHPKIESQVDVLRKNLEHNFGKTNHQIVHGVEGAANGIAMVFKDLSTTVGTALGGLGTEVNSMLKALGVSNKDIKFTASVAGAAGSSIGTAGEQAGGWLGKQRGGHINLGKPSGDSVPAMLERDEYVLNRNAVAAVGRDNLDALNFGAAARFQKGGSPGIARPQISGPEPLASLGQAGLNLAYKGAKHYIAEHLPKGGGGPVLEEMARVLRKAGANRIGTAGFMGNSYRESNDDPSAVGTGGGGLFGFTSGAISLASLQAAAKRGGVPWDDAAFQTEFMLRHGGAALIPAMNKQPSPEASAKYFMENWERPGIPALGEREAAARKAFAQGYQSGGMVGNLPDKNASRSELAYWKKLGIPGFAKGGSPSNAPSALERMLARAKELKGIPYVLGGGHGGFSAHPSSLDCSGAVSDVLHAGGFLSTPETSGALEGFGKSGPGKLTIFANAGHTFMDFLGRFWGTSVDDNGAGGLGFHSAPPASYLASFVKRHVPEGALGSSSISGSGFTEKVAKQIKGTYGPKAGTTGAGGGTNAGQRHYKVTTGSLSFGSLPTTLEACNRELAERRKQLPEYRGAIADAKHDPKTKQALVANEKAITRRIAQLVKQKARLVTKRIAEHATKKIVARGVFPSIEQTIGSREREYNLAAQFAEQVTALEPEEGPAAAYINGPETAAWSAVLGTEAGWRNALLGGEEAAGTRLRSLEGQIEQINALKNSAPKAYKKQKFKLPSLREAVQAVKSVFTPAQATSFKALANGNYTAASGTFPEALAGLQGPEGFVGDHLQMAPLPSTPVPGSFGGQIFGTQMTMRELGLKLKQAGSGAGPSPEHEALLRELLTQANQRELIRNAQAGVSVPYAGAYAKGGVVAALTGENGPEISTFPVGTRITPADETRRLLGGNSSPNVAVHIYPGEPERTAVEVDDQRVDARIERHDRRGARGGNRGLARAGVFG